MARCTETVVRNYALVMVLFVGLVVAEDLMLNVNIKKPIAIVSEKFLSITLDPVLLFDNDVISDMEKSVSMAKALAPAYVRIAGPRSNAYVFERDLYSQKVRPSPGYAFSEAHWTNVHKWAKRAGLDVIACIAPQMTDKKRSWDPRNALDLISFSDHLGYNTSWQLGYECQTRCKASGSELGREVQRLRSMLDAFPRYSNNSNAGIIVGPDVVSYKTHQQQQYLLDYFNAAASALTAVTWHPEFAGISLEAEGVSIHHDNLALEKESLFRIAGRHIMKKPLWIAESKSEECKQQFLGALVWARRLGNSAKLGIQVLMRQPDNSNLFRPTPDYWVSMLHKMLVGREVLDTKVAFGNRTHVSFYSQCTKPSSRYEKGSLTIFGINLTPTNIIASIKGLRAKVIHRYILLPGFDAPNRMFAETTLLNNKLLTLTESKEVPKVRPIVYSAEKGIQLKLPSGGIGFWVLPGLKIKTCMEYEDETTEKSLLKKIIKQNEDSAFEVVSDNDNNSGRVNVDSQIEGKKLKQQQIEKRPLLRRGDRHKEYERNDLEELRRLRVSQLELAKRDLERLDRVMHKQDSLSKKYKNNNRVFDKSVEKKEDISSEKATRGKSIASLRNEKDIRAKLQEYYKSLGESETSKIQNDLTIERVEEKSKSPNKSMDIEKVIKALTLITKVENAMNYLERESKNETIDSILTPLNIDDTNNLTLDLQKDSENSDTLLEDVLNSEKSNRTIVPTKIEDQLKALYQLLSEEKENVESRQRRDLNQHPEKEFVDTQQDDSYNPTRGKIEVKEHRQEHVSELKQRHHERQEQRKQRHQRDNEEEIDESEENEFYGFQTQPPLENFPEGDVYVQTSIDSVENVNEQQQIPRTRTVTVTRVPIIKDEDENNWTGGGKSPYMPKESYENTGRQRFDGRKNMKEYGDLWEADLSNKNEGSNIQAGDTVESINEKIAPEPDNKKTKEQTNRQIVNDYQSFPITNSYGYENLKRIQQSQPIITYRQNIRNINAGRNPSVYANEDRYYTYPSQRLVNSESSYRRTKRHINDLEKVLRQEMLSQDDNNSKDCQCRVIRGIEECKDCTVEQKAQEMPSMVITPAPIFQYPTTNSFDPRYKTRQDTEKIQPVTKNETTIQENESENVDTSTCTNEETKKNEKIMTTKVVMVKNQNLEQIEKVKVESSTEKKLVELNKTEVVEEPTTTTKTDKLKLEDDSEIVAGNRLPRKIATTPKSFIKIRASQSKENLQKPENSSSLNDSNTNATSATDGKTKTNQEQSKTRIVTESSDSLSNKFSKKDKITKLSKESNVEQSSRGKDSRTSSSASVNVKTVSEPVTEKSMKNDLISRAKERRSGKNSGSERKSKQIEKSTSETPVTRKAIYKRNSTDTSTANIGTANATNAELKAKNNLTGKLEEANKLKLARSTTRAEAKKESESRRAKKLMEQSLKDIDNAKLEELKRKRREQLEKYKLKLREKRDKMLHQYRSELIQAINENSDIKYSNIKKRDLSMKDEPNVETGKNESSGVTQTSINTNENNNNYKINNKRQSTPIKIQFADEIHDIVDDEVRSTDKKISPNTYTDRHFGKRHNYREAEIEYDMSGEDNRKYYMHQYPQYRYAKYQYQPQVIYNKEAVVQSMYGPNYYEPNPMEKPVNYMNYYKSAINLQKQKDNRKNDEDASEQQGENSPETIQEEQGITDKPQELQDEQSSQENESEQYSHAEENVYEISKYPQTQYETIIPSDNRAKRPNLKIFETDPSTYEDDDFSYDLQNLRVEPSYRLSPMNYRHDSPYGYVNRRYKREANKKQLIDAPLTFSLGLEKTKMNEIKDDIGSPLGILYRKRVAEDFPGTRRTSTNKNVKKVLKDYYDKNRKTPKGLKYSQTLVKNVKDNSPSFNDKKIVKSLIETNSQAQLNNQIKNKRKRDLQKRKKRSINSGDDYRQVIKENGISHSDDPEMDEIWNNIVEMKQKKKLLQEYNKRKSEIVDNFKETHRNLEKYLESTGFDLLVQEQNNNATKSDLTTQTNIETIVIDTLPKIETVITGGLKKAQNVTGSFEDFIETIDEEYEKSTENPSSPDSSKETNDDRLTHNVFQNMLGNVKKFFDLVSTVTTILYSS